MPTILNNTPDRNPESSGGDGIGVIVGVIVGMLLIALFVIYGLPAMRGNETAIPDGTNGTNINVDVPDINPTPVPTPSPAPITP